MENSPLLNSQILQNRTITNPKFLITFIIFVLFWIITVIIGCSVGDGEKIFTDDVVKELKHLDLKIISIIIGFCLLAEVYFILLYLAMRIIPNFLYIILGTFWIPVAMCISDATSYATWQSIYFSFGTIFSCAFLYFLINSEWFHLPEKILKETCKVIFSLPGSIFILTIGYIICLAIISIIITAFLYINTITNLYAILNVINIFCGVWLLTVIFTLTQMTISMNIANWYWTLNKNEITYATTLRCLKTTFRHHIGTAACGTSILGAIEIFYNVLARMISNFMDNCTITYVFFVIYNLFDGIVMKFTLSGSILLCAIEGEGFTKSIEKSLNYLEEHPRRCLGFTKIMEYAIVLVTTIVSILMFVSLFAYVIASSPLPFDSPNTSYNFRLGIMISFIISLLTILPFLTAIFVGCGTILFCFLKDVEYNNGSEQRPYAMSRELASAIEASPPDWFRKLNNCHGRIPVSTNIEE